MADLFAPTPPPNDAKDNLFRPSYRAPSTIRPSLHHPTFTKEVVQRPIWHHKARAMMSTYKGLLIGSIVFVIVALTVGLYFALTHKDHPHTPHLYKRGKTVEHTDVPATVETGYLVWEDRLGNDMSQYSFGQEIKLSFYPDANYALHGPRQFQLIINDNIVATHTTPENTVLMTIPIVSSKGVPLTPDKNCYAQMVIMSGDKGSFTYQTAHQHTVGYDFAWSPKSPGHQEGDQFQEGDTIQFEFTYQFEPLGSFSTEPHDWTLSTSIEKEKSFAPVKISKVAVQTGITRTVTISHEVTVSSKPLYFRIAYYKYSSINILTTPYSISITLPKSHPSDSPPSDSPPLVSSISNLAIYAQHGHTPRYFNQNQDVLLIFDANVQNLKSSDVVWKYRTSSTISYVNINNANTVISKDSKGKTTVHTSWTMPATFSRSTEFQIQAVVNALSTTSPKYTIQPSFYISKHADTIYIDRTELSQPQEFILSSFPAFSETNVWGSSPVITFSIFGKTLSSEHVSKNQNWVTLDMSSIKDLQVFGDRKTTSVTASITVDGYTVTTPPVGILFIWKNRPKVTYTIQTVSKFILSYVKGESVYNNRVIVARMGSWHNQLIHYHFTIRNSQISALIDGENGRYYLSVEGNYLKMIPREDTVGWTAEIVDSDPKGGPRYKLKRGSQYVGVKKISDSNQPFNFHFDPIHIQRSVDLLEINSSITSANAAVFYFPAHLLSEQ